MNLRRSWYDHTVTWQIEDIRTRKAVGKWSVHTKEAEPPMDVLSDYIPPAAFWSDDSARITQVEYWPSDNDRNDGQTIRISQRDARHPDIAQTYPTAVIPYEARVEIFGGSALVIPFNQVPKFKVEEWRLEDPVGSRRSWEVTIPKRFFLVAYYPSPDYHRALWFMGTPGAKTTDGAFPFNSVSL